MNTFTDGNDRQWSIDFDAIIFEDIEAETGVDLADLSAGGLARTQLDVKLLVNVIAICHKDTIVDRREFAKGIKGEVIIEAKKAVLGAAERFFPQSEWSVMQSHLAIRLAQQRVVNQAWATMGVNAEKPSKEFILGMFQELASAGTPSTDDPSASGPENTPSSPATDTPASAELVPSA